MEAMGDLNTENHISLDEARCLPWLSKRYGFTTIWTWATVGKVAGDGSRVRLETVREGGRLVTSEGAMRRFGERLSAEKPAARTKSQATRDHGRAVAALAAFGFKTPSNKGATAVAAH